MNHYFHEAFQQAIRTGPIIFMHWYWDEKMNPIDFVSPNVEHILGYTVEELLSGQTRLINIFVEEYQPIFLSNLRSHIANSDTYWSASYQIYTKENVIKHIRTYAYVEEAIQSDMLSIYTYVIDETELIHRINKEQQLTTRYKVAIESAGEGIWDWNYTTNEIFFSEILKSMLGYTNQEMKNQFSDWQQLVHPEDMEAVMVSLFTSIKNHSSYYEMEYRMLHKDGTYRWILSRGKVVPSKENTKFNRMIGTNVDITEQKNTEFLLVKRNEELENLLCQIKELSITDPLTSLFNRRKILEDLTNAQKDVEENNEQFTISIIDIDYFKRINDTFGHSIGDETLKLFANFIKSNVRKVDIVGRWGGEEFFIIFPRTTLEQAFQVLTRLNRACYQLPFVIKGNTIRLTFSAGISTSQKNETVDEIVSQADDALYEAKESGRNLVVKYDKEKS